MRDGPYTVREVARLLGLYEDRRWDGRRDPTLLDIISWSRDPGGMHLQREDDPEPWMARRGPLAPDSAEAVALWDFLRAMRKLGPLHDQAIVALLVMGFQFSEIAEVFYGDRRKVKNVSRRILGRARVDPETGKVIRRWPGGPVMRESTGLVHRMTDLMNGDR